MATATAHSNTYSPLTEEVLSSLPKKFRNAINQELREEHIADILDNQGLNEQQKEAVSHEDGPMVVLACAGSGKTTVMKWHACMATLRGIPACQILMLSFTNKAVDEMKERVYTEMAKFTNSRPIISTIHGLAGKILRKHAPLVGYRTDYEIISDETRQTALKSALKAVSFEYVASMGDKKEDAVGALERQISDWKNELVSYTDEEIKDHPLQAAYQRYQLHLHRGNVLDCDDMIRLAVEILHRDPELCAEWQKRYQKVIVDEFQDVNTAQFTLLRMITEKSESLCVVGDDDQSIYGWRGAKVDLIQTFHKHYENIHRVTLFKNYRSLQPILNLANNLMSHVKKRVKKTLTADRQIEKGKEGAFSPRFIVYDSNREQAEDIANEINREVIEKKTRRFKDYVIIVRNSKSMDQPISQMLQKDIPHEIWNTENVFLGDIRRNVLSLLAVIHSPESNDIGLMELIQSSRFSIPESDFDRLMLRNDQGDTTLWDIITSEDEKVHYSEECQEAFQDLESQVNALREMYNELQGKVRMNETARAAMEVLYPERTTGEWYKLDIREISKRRSEYAGQRFQEEISVMFGSNTVEEEVYDGETENTDDLKEQKPKDAADWSYVTETLASILHDIKQWQPGVAGPTFKAYLGWKQFQRKLAKLPPTAETQEEEDQGAVVITTIHRAKGLEWPVGYVIDMNENDLPGWRTLQSDDQDLIDEDTRLALVAITRMKDHLRVSSTRYHYHGQRRVYHEVSRFVEWMGLYKHTQDKTGGQKHLPY